MRDDLRNLGLAQAVVQASVHVKRQLLDLACRNQRLVDGRPARYDSPTIMVGGRESYEARCRHCHEVPRADEDQVVML